MPSDSVAAPTPSHPTGRFPRAAWIGAAVLGLVAAAVAGALVMRTVDGPAQPVPALAANSAPSLPVGQPVPLNNGAAETAPLHGIAGQPVPLNDGSAPPAPQAVPVPTPVPAPAPNTAPARAVSPTPAPAPTVARAAVCNRCGVVESVVAVREKRRGTGVGAVAGGVLGGVVGHQVGGGHGKTALTVLGAVGGVLAGNEVEKRVRATTHYDVHVRMANGRVRTFRRESALAVGARVVVEGSTLRLARTKG
jgi:outer membrane lipoprotein SlyB